MLESNDGREEELDQGYIHIYMGRSMFAWLLVHMVLSQPYDKICLKKATILNKKLVTVRDFLYSHHVFQPGYTCLELDYLVMCTDSKWR